MAGLRPRPVLEGESRVPLARIVDHQASWAQWFADSPVPGVLRARWFEQRHMMHHTRRWNRDHRRRAAARPGSTAPGCCCGTWCSACASGGSTATGTRCAGCGRPTRPPRRSSPKGSGAAHRPAPRRHGRGDLAGSPRGYPRRRRALHAGPTPPGRSYDVGRAPRRRLRWGPRRRRGRHRARPRDRRAGLAHVPAGAARPAGLEERWPTTRPTRPRSQRLERPVPARVLPGAARPDVRPTTPSGSSRASATSRASPGGSGRPACTRARRTSSEWKPLPPRLHDAARHRARSRSAPWPSTPREVTNDEYAAFLAETGYRPPRPSRFLAHWVDGAPASGTGRRAGHATSTSRTPGPTPGGGTRGCPPRTSGRPPPRTLVWRRGEPLVWSWTESEHSDGRTRWVMLKGGSWFTAEGSEWYVDGGSAARCHRQVLLPAGTRSSIGFRCAGDLVSDRLRPACATAGDLCRQRVTVRPAATLR